MFHNIGPTEAVILIVALIALIAGAQIFNYRLVVSDMRKQDRKDAPPDEESP